MGITLNRQVIGTNSSEVAGLIRHELLFPLEVVVLPFPHPVYLLQSPALYMEMSVRILVRELTQLKTNCTEKQS